MSEQLDHKTFDLLGVLSGRDYPTHEVDIYLNEALGFELFQVEQKRRDASLPEGERAKRDEEFRGLMAQAEKEKFTVRMKAIPEQVRMDIVQKLEEEYPEKKDFMGKPQENLEKDTEFTKRMWRAYIQAVVDPSGAVATVGEEEVNALYANAPSTAHDTINTGLAELQIGPKAGFEAKAKETNFLSEASPEG